MSPVYLSVEPQALSCLQDTLVSLLEKSAGAKSVIVIGSLANEPDIRRIAARVSSTRINLEFVFSEASDHLSLALGIAAISGAAGALFVKSGVTVPYAWDVRLERIAQHNPKIGTVSPLCDSFEMFSLLGEEGRVKVAPGDTQYVDSLTFSLSSRTYIEVPRFLEVCFYISSAAIELATTKADRGNHGDPESGWELARLLSANGYLNVLGDCLYVYSVCYAGADREKYLLAQDSVQSIIRAEPLKRLGLKILEAFSGKITFGNMPGLDSKPVQLHVLHGWGGGLERWVRDYCSADKTRTNLILKSTGRADAFGGLVLFSGVDDATPIQTWEFSLPIQGTAVSHLDYANAIDEIIRRYSVDAILVSSLIGHSLDILNTSKQTILIGHDYYPYCPAINITFDSLCTSCEFPRLAQCFKQNILNCNFRNVGEDDWSILREMYLSIIQAKRLKLVIPSRSVKDNLVKLEPRYSNVDFVLIPHGVSSLRAIDCAVPHHQSVSTKLRVLVLGALAPSKGLNLLKDIAAELTSFAELFLVGSGNGGKFFESMTLGGIIYSYDLDELPQIIHDINPDIALLLSVVPETFSYTLSELTDLRVPVVATRLGNFTARIEDGKTGFLVEPAAEEVIRKIKVLDADRAKITWVKGNLAQVESKSVAGMVTDYQRILPLPNLPIARFQIEQYSKSLNFLVSDLRYQELLQNENELTQLLSSRIWWVTAPFRRVNNYIARLTGKIARLIGMNG